MNTEGDQDPIMKRLGPDRDVTMTRPEYYLDETMVNLGKIQTRLEQQHKV